MSTYRRQHVPLSDVHATPVKTEGAGSGKPKSEWGRYTSVSAPVASSVLAKRKPQQPNNVLLKYAAQWADTLPQDVQPRILMREYPRIANMVALLWTEPTRTAFDDYMESLLVERRGNRQGFPPAVVTDLLTLRAAFDDRHRPR